jgi:serine protease Do
VEIYRNGAPLALSVAVGEWQDPEAEPQASAAEGSSEATNRLGLDLALPTPVQRRERAIERGLVVQRADGAAARAEIVVGDVVLAMVVGGRQVTLDKLEDFNRLAAELKPGQQVTLLIRRADATSYVTLRAAR